jgi:AcrR family transcriptional regulator
MLDAVIAAVASRGYSSLTLQAIAHETGMSPARLSYHFGTKKRLFLEALAQVEDRAADEVEATLRGARSHWARIAKIIGGSIPHGVGDPEWQIWLAAFNEAPYDVDIAAVLALSSSRFIERLVRAIEDGVAAGEFTVTSAVDTATVVTAALDGLAIECVAGVPGRSRRRVKTLVLGLLRRELGLPAL